MKILVTGGSGFIGSHLVDLLLDKGHQVSVVDGHPVKNKNAEWIDGDLRWIGDCDKAVEGKDIVFHLAARISIDESIDRVLHYFNDNYLSTINICMSCKKYDIKRLVDISSCEVYGNVPKGKADESNPCNPTSPYAASKYAAERSAIAFCNSFNIPITVIRPFNVFGERQKAFRGGSVIPTFIQLALHNKPLIIHGDGNQIRDYLYVKDTVGLLALTLERELGNTEILNVASGKGRTIKDIAEKIVRYTKSNSKLEFINDPRGKAQMLRSVGNSSRARTLLGWKPIYDFDLALKKTIEFYKSIE